MESNTNFGTAFLSDTFSDSLNALGRVAIYFILACMLLGFGLFLGFMWMCWDEGYRWIDYTIVAIFLLWLIRKILKATRYYPINSVCRFLRKHVSEEQVKTFMTFRQYGCDIGVPYEAWVVLGVFGAQMTDIKDKYFIEDRYLSPERTEELDRVWLRVMKNRPQDLIDFVKLMKPFTREDIMHFSKYCPFKTGMWS